MKIEIDKDQLIQVLTPAQGLVEKRNIIPILSKVLLKFENQKLEIYATDQENSLQGFVAAKGSKGAVCVDSKNLFEIIKELPQGKISLEKPEKKEVLRIKAESSLFNMVGVKPEDFPVFPYLKKPVFFSLKSEDLLASINQTSYCVSTDETRYHLNGVLCEKHSNKLRFVATDGHRLSYVDQATHSEVSPSSRNNYPKKRACRNDSSFIH